MSWLNIPLPSTTSESSETTSSSVAYSSAASAPTGYYNYHDPQYQQYLQQYYSNAYATAYAQQQYAGYYQANPGSANAIGSTLYQNAAQAEEDDEEECDEEEDDEDPTVVKKKSGKQSNILTYHCNEKMGLNPLIYTNIQQSPYFKNNLFQLKTYHEVIDEIYYSVKHLEPWEKGSRKVSILVFWLATLCSSLALQVSGQTGMCGSVRGVGAGGIISTPFCILFKLFTLRLTRKQVNGLLRHKDSPFIRALGFMYIRYTQPPQDLWQWYKNYLDDPEEFDPKAGGGAPMTIGEMARYFLTKLDWFSTLFPRIPIPIQKEIEEKLRQHDTESRPTSKPRDKKEDKADYKSSPGQSSKSRRSRSRSRSPFNRHSNHRRNKRADDPRYSKHSSRY